MPQPLPAWVVSKSAAHSPIERLHRMLDWGEPFEPSVISEALDKSALAAAALFNGSASQTWQKSHVYPAPLRVPLPCSLEAAFALVAYADVVRLADGAGSQQFRRALHAIQRCLHDVHERDGWLLPQLLNGNLPLLAALDRLECYPDADVLSSSHHDLNVNRNMS